MGRRKTEGGVEVRTTSIRVSFQLNGELIRETIKRDGKSVKPLISNINAARRLVLDVEKAIAQGVFVYGDFFPDSPRAAAKLVDDDSFGRLADLWLESKGRLESASKDQYGTAVRFWKRLFGADVAVRSITHKVVAAKIGGFAWKSAKQHNNYLIALRGIMGMEYRGTRTLENPLVDIENMPVIKRPPDPLSPAERDAVLADMRKHYDPRIAAYYQFMFFTGMRPEEAIALRWSDVDWNLGTARVQRVRTFKGSEREGSKTHTVRDVELTPPAVDALKTMKGWTYMKAAEREGDEDTACDIFENPVTRRPWHDERSQRDHYWKPALKRQGIRARRSYATRHTFCTVALMAGVPPAYIASQAGHSVQMLLGTYAKWIPGADGGSARGMLALAMGGSTIQKAVNE